MILSIDAFKISQPIGDFYIGKIKAKTLYDISKADVRRMEIDENGIESYLGIQRKTKDSRVKEIKDYISTIDATFPNSIIISINNEELDEELDEELFKKDKVTVTWSNNKLEIEYPEEKQSYIANILDGQHRMAGFDDGNFTYESYDGEVKPFELVVTIFVNSDMSLQAKVFAMVNQNQTKVNKSLVYDLESLSKSRSPWRSSHLIAVYLNSRENSPFYHRIKRLGVKSRKDENEPLTQAAFVDNLVKLISPIPQSDRNYLIRKEKSMFNFKNNEPDRFEKKDLIDFPFRKFFFDGNDKDIMKIVFCFFAAVNDVWPKAWDKDNSRSVLNKTVGLISMMRLLKKILSNELMLGGDILSFDTQRFTSILRGIDFNDGYFESAEATTKTGVKIYKDIAIKIWGDES